MIKVVSSDFFTTSSERDNWPPPIRPEVAFVGRSNVGKSSMINCLCNRRKLVRVSNTPGRTRTLNFFDVLLEKGPRTREMRLVDLPGYGYAKASKTDRNQWQQMADAYLQQRPVLKVVVSIIDAEIGPTEDDEQMLQVLMAAPPKILVAATKIDRLARTKQKNRVVSIAHKLGLPVEAVIGFSSTERIGVQPVWESLLQGADLV